MECPHCKGEVPGEAQFCPGCGKAPNPTAKILCDGCMGAFPAEELVRVGERSLCSLCRAREKQLRSGTPAPGHARMHFTDREFKAEKGLLRPRTSLLAVFSLVTVFLCPVGLLSVLLGALALLRIRSRPKELAGAGFAVAGILLGAGAFLVVLGLAALSVPLYKTLEQSRQAALLQANMEVLAAVEREYLAEHDRFGSWRELVNGGYLDPVRTHVDGYDLDVEATEEGFRVVATPKIGGPPTHYLLDEEGTFRHEEGRPATRFSPVWRHPFHSSAPRRRSRPASSG